MVFGRGSTGGVIEQESKLPKLQPLIAGTLTGGTDSTRRATLDVNEPLTGLGEGAAFRISAMGHEADGGELVIGEAGDEKKVKLPAGDLVLYSGGTVHPYCRLREACAWLHSFGCRA